MLECYGHVTLQGRPVHGLRRFGVPPGGAFDRTSYAIANALVGNESDALCLELAMASVRIRALSDCTIALTGAQCTTAPQHIDAIIRLSQDEELKIDPPQRHCRAYLAIAGGFEKRNWNELLKSGTVLNCANNPITSQEVQTPVLREDPISVIPFETKQLPRQLLETEFQVSLQSNRVGIRLTGAEFEPGEERLSEPACPGSIQVTNDGNLIILGPDGPTIGGYRKIGVVASKDMTLVAQLRPGGICRFKSA